VARAEIVSAPSPAYLPIEVVERALDQIHLDLAQRRECDRRLLEPPLARELIDLGLAQPAVLHGGLDRCRG